MRSDVILKGQLCRMSRNQNRVMSNEDRDRAAKREAALWRKIARIAREKDK